MSKTTKAYIAVFVIGTFYAFLAVLTFFAALLMSFSFESRIPVYLVLVFYIGGNAIFGGAIGALSGLRIKRRFFAPFVHLIALLLGSYIMYFEGTPYFWACIIPTICFSFIALIISAVVTALKKHRMKQNFNYNQALNDNIR